MLVRSRLRCQQFGKRSGDGRAPWHNPRVVIVVRSASCTTAQCVDTGQKAAASRGRAKVSCRYSDASCGTSSGLRLEQLNLRGWRAGDVVMAMVETAVVATTIEVRARGSPSQRSRERAAITLPDGAHQSSGRCRASTPIRRHQLDGKRSRACPPC